jgi:hypothetical protein
MVTQGWSTAEGEQVTTQPTIGAWTPGLDDRATLGDVYHGMPGDPDLAIPWYVRLLENPASRIALPGAIDLFGHDCIHITLGRGMLPQDEAFVIGVTMGASGGLAGWQHRLYTYASRRIYRGPYRFSRSDLRVFDIGLDFARRHRLPALHRVAWRDLLDRPLGAVRAAVGVDRDALFDAYDRERRVLPDSPAAVRLPGPGDRTTAAW